MKAIALNLRITPKKLNLIAGLVRGKGASEAIDILNFTPKKAARILGKVVKSAVANAENNFKQERESLYVKEIVVGKATTLKRSVPISRGRTHPILKRSSHVKVLIGVKEGVTAKTAAKKTFSKEKTAAPAKVKETPVKAARSKKTEKNTKVKA